MRAKIAISIPTTTLAKLEKKRRELDKSRSAVIVEALDAWLAGDVLTEEDRRYLAGYMKHPEQEHDVAALASTWGEWDEA